MSPIPHVGAFDQSAVQDILNIVPEGNVGPGGAGFVPLTASGAIPVGPPLISAAYQITKAGVAAMTLAAPVAGADDGKVIWVESNTANAHTITATGLLQTGAAGVNVLTFAAFAGAACKLMALSGKWVLVLSIGITPS